MTQTTTLTHALTRALDQSIELLASIREEDLDRATPCDDWSLRQLADHVAVAPENFLKQAWGQEVDWSAPATIPVGRWSDRFQPSAEDLAQFWLEQPAEAQQGAGLPIVELAVHAWDLAIALSRTLSLDDDVAEVALAIIQAGLTDEMRGEVFGPAVAVPDDAWVYNRLAAFSGREIGTEAF